MRFNPGDRVKAFGGMVTGTFYGYIVSATGCNCSIRRDDHVSGGGPERTWLMYDTDLELMNPKSENYPEDLFWQEE